MNSVRGNATGLSFNCHLCDSSDPPIGQHDKRQVKASCPDSHVFHWKCITKWFDSEQQAGKSLGTRKCSQCQQQAEPFILMSGDTVPGKYSSYCKSLDTPVFKDNTGRAKNDPSLGKIKDKQGNTTLHEAVLRGSKEKVEEILRDTSSLNLVKMKNNKSETAFDMAVRRNLAKIVEVFMKKDETLAWKDGTSALHKAVESNSSETVKVLLTIAPALDKIRNKDNKTALQIATDKGYTKTVNVFKEFTASLADHEKGNSTLTTNMKLDDTDKTAQAGSVVTSDPVPTDSETAVDSRKKPLNEGASPVVNGKFCTSSTLSENRDALAAYAAEKDSTECLLEYLASEKVKIKDVDESGKTALHYAAEKGHEPCLKYLIKNGAGINHSDNSGKTALHYAAEEGHEPCLKYLIDNGAGINHSDNSGKTALDYAAEQGHSQCLKHLISEENINKTDDSKKTALHYAAEQGHSQCLEHLISKENINKTDDSEKTALHYAILNKDEKCLVELLKKLQDISPANRNHALRLAIDKNYHSASTEALVKTISLGEQDKKDGKTLLHYAAEKGNKNYLEKFLEKAKTEGNLANSINLKDHKNRVPLHYAAKNGYSNCLQLLLEDKKLTCINAQDENGDTPLLLAALTNSEACVRKLIEAKADVHVKNNKGIMLLHRIAISEKRINWLEVKDYNYYKDIKGTDKDDNTPLHYAAFHGNLKFLLKIYTKEVKTGLIKKKLIKDKDFHTNNKHGVSPLLVAIHNDNKNDCLIKLIKTIELTDEQLSRLFLYAAAHGKNDCLQRLDDEDYKSKIDINHTEQISGRASLHYVVIDKCWNHNSSQEAQKYIYCLNHILSFDKVDANLPDNEGKTPLHLAAEADNIYCLLRLLSHPKYRVNINAEDKQNNKPLDLAKHPVCQEALQEDWNNLNDCERKDKVEYYRNKYEGQACQTNDQNENTHSQSNPVDLSDGSIRYQEKVFINDEVVGRLDEIKVKYPDLNFIPCPKVNSFLVLAKDFFGKIIKDSHEDAIFGYSGIRENLYTINPKDLTQIYVPIQFMPEFKPENNNLSLNGYPFHIEGTKGKIIEFLDKYKRFHFTAKSIDKKELSKARVSVNIKLCLVDFNMSKMVRKFIATAIKDAFGIPIPLDFIDIEGIIAIIEHVNLKDLVNEISDAVNTTMKILQEELQKEPQKELQKEVVNTSEKMLKNLSSAAEEQPEKIASKKIDSVINKILNELKRLNETDDIDTSLSKNNFKVCSGPINLLHNIKSGQKIQIEFDRFESSDSPARLQINSTGSQVEFKDLSEALKMIFEM
ncbi:ankyrin repeat domain-containing protein [Thalassotalea sp. G20_0]|uniref:ankyrin repeat domain-containing protein n=1 Tax=Thalassotalea sp. G20_0 TaxID=2821093 RepID=UPI001ADAE440|nr:ankyrin repeat domain-containing protein [Thalassotalea sp. G20_0]MBO9494019.1 ankyrin repeat domain-containing protein [Thalassotalea sp. G20_0]